MSVPRWKDQRQGQATPQRRANSKRSMSALPELPERQRVRQGNVQTPISTSGHRSTSTSGFSSSSRGGSQSPPSVNFGPLSVIYGDLNNLLKLRTNFKFTALSSRLPNRLVGHFGADLNLQQQSLTPAARLQCEVHCFLTCLFSWQLCLRPRVITSTHFLMLQIVRNDKYLGLLQADTSGISYKRPIRFSKGDFSCEVAPKVGCSWQGM